MLRLDPFRVERPATVDEALALLAAHGGRSKVLAGGTDLLPNLKHGLYQPEVVVSIGAVAGLRGVKDAGDALEIGALTTLLDLEHDPLVARFAPGLARAAAEVAGPQLRRMGTLGGNLCLDTRCLYFNQSHFWREALGYCLKKDGTACHVVADGKKCVAAASNDTATMLLALDAEVELRSSSGSRRVLLDAFYVPDGVRNTVLQHGELLTSVLVPKGSPARREGYAKLRHRKSIDFPLLSVAVRLDLEGAAPGTVKGARLVVSALQARPNRVPVDALVGKPLDEATVTELGRLAYARCHPMTNIADDPAWRREMVPVLVRRAVADASHA
ncbi:MAG: FAD binding domain-containing protein [Deltaproteobacteria bacterium]|nr:FAD binding domain-containing protein [Deltaproteobacteria bacterium]